MKSVFSWHIIQSKSLKVSRRFGVTCHKQSSACHMLHAKLLLTFKGIYCVISQKIELFISQKGIDTVSLPETSVNFCHNTRTHIPEDSNTHTSLWERTEWAYIIVGASVAYNFPTGSNKAELPTEYERVTVNVSALPKKTFWVTLPYSVNSFILLLPVGKL
jgi:hypothetical protein